MANTDARRWSDSAAEIFDALVSLLGRPTGKKGRSMSAYRQAARLLADLGVKDLDAVLREYAIASLRPSGPMPLVSFLRGAETKEPRIVAVQRWPVGCELCADEVVRGALAWIAKDDDGKWRVTCRECIPIEDAWERVRVAHRRAVERDDDPESLLAAILEFTPPEFREEVEDDLSTVVAVLAEGS